MNNKYYEAATVVTKTIIKMAKEMRFKVVLVKGFKNE